MGLAVGVGGTLGTGQFNGAARSGPGEARMPKIYMNTGNSKLEGVEGITQNIMRKCSPLMRADMTNR
jgi:hypothetical protein